MTSLSRADDRQTQPARDEQTALKAWFRPELNRIAAGSAEAGNDTDNSDGFSFS